MKTLTSLLASALLFSATAVNAAALTPLSFSATTLSGNPSSITGATYAGDSSFPTERAFWKNSTAWWHGTDQVMSFTYTQVFNIEEILLSVDNNDEYRVQSSLDGSTWSTLFDINRSHGEHNYGMDTMSTLAGHGEYIAALNFAPVQAKFLRIFATGGDNSYSVGEFQAYGSTVSAVPVPAAALMFAPALLGFMGLRRKIKNTA
jgi:hypothetical protein